jgi:hypothetical protein
MKAFVFAALCAVVAAGCSPALSTTTEDGSELPRSLLDPYLKIQEALAEDSLEGVQQNAGALTTESTKLGAPGMRIQTAAAQLTSPGEIEDARVKFANLSVALDEYMKGFKMTLPEGVRNVWCPMKAKPWMQEGDVVKNPYYGSEMSTCGEFR